MPLYQLLTDRTLAEASAITPTTLIHIVTTADTRQNPAGSSYKAELGQLVGIFGGTFTGGTVSGATNFTGGISANTISATTYQNLPLSGLTEGSNISISGTNGNFTISVTGVTGGSTFTGGTVSGATNFTGGLTANTISATTYLNLPQFSGGSGNCITDLYVSNIHSCSPLNINPLDEGNVYFGSTSGVTVDVINSRLGIGTNNPQYPIEVISNNSQLFYNPTSAGGLLVVSGQTSIPRMGVIIPPYLTNPSAAVTLGLRAWDDIIYTTYGNVGDTFLRATDESNGLNLINSPGVGTQDYIRFYAGNQATATPDIHIQGSGATRGYVGIGTESPSEILDVNGKTKTANFQMTSGANNGYVLTSDASGNASWQIPTGGGGTFTGGTVSGVTNFTGGLTATTISATTYNNLPVSGLTAGTNIGLTNNNGNFTISVTGITGGSTFTGGTVSGATNFTGGLTANTISATTYQNLPITGTNNYLSKFSSGSTILVDSQLSDNGSTVGLGVPPNVNAKLYVLTSSELYGLAGLNQNTNGVGVYGQAFALGNTIGVAGVANGTSTSNIGVFGRANDATTNIGLRGYAFNGTNNYSAQLQDGTEGIGKILTCVTSDGKANWQNLPSLINPFNNSGSGATITWDVSGVSTNYEATLTATTTLNLTNVRNGDYGTIIIKQDGVGGRTLTLGTVNGPAGTHRVVNGGGGTVVLTSNANATDILTFTYNGSIMYWTVGNDYT